MTAGSIVLALVISAAVVLWTSARWVGGRLNPAEDLPIGLCNFTALIAPAQALTGSPLLTAWAICVGGPAGFVSLLAPDIRPEHPPETHLKFWIVHVGLVGHALVCAALYAPAWRPQLGLLLLAMIAGIGAVAIAANGLLSSNYLFLRAKPATASPLDWFGDWPIYLLPMAIATCAAVSVAFLGWSLAWR